MYSLPQGSGALSMNNPDFPDAFGDTLVEIVRQEVLDIPGMEGVKVQFPRDWDYHWGFFVINGLQGNHGDKRINVRGGNTSYLIGFL